MTSKSIPLCGPVALISSSLISVTLQGHPILVLGQRHLLFSLEAAGACAAVALFINDCQVWLLQNSENDSITSM